MIEQKECGKMRFTLTGNDVCVHEEGHSGDCEFVEHSCADCGVKHGVCRECGTTHGDSHEAWCIWTRGQTF